MTFNLEVDLQAGQSKRINLLKWLKFVFIGWGSAVLSLFLAVLMGTLLINVGAPDWLWKLVQGLIFSGLIIIVMLFMQKRMNKNIWSFIRLTPLKTGLPNFALGILIPVVLVTVGVLIGHSLGWITFQGFHVSIDLLLAVLINMVIAFLYEAFPEEVILRGYLYSVLRLRMGRLLSVLFQTILFVLFPVALTGLQYLFRMSTSPITPDYIILIFTFGIVLTIVRLMTNNLWVSIGFHLAYLEIARFVVPQGEYTYMKGIQSFLIYDELEPGVGTVFLLLFMVILIPIIIGTSLLFVKNQMKKRR